jgi:hypothetical protein
VEDELRGSKVSDLEKKQMMQLLGKFEKESLLGNLENVVGDGEEEEAFEIKRDLLERLGGLDLSALSIYI